MTQFNYSKDVDAYNKLLKQLSGEQQKTDNLNVTENSEQKTNKVVYSNSNSTINEIQAKPNRRPSQSLIKPKVFTYNKFKLFVYYIMLFHIYKDT